MHSNGAAAIVRFQKVGRGALRVVRCMAASDAAQLKSAREDIKELLKTTYCHPIMVRRAPCLHYAVFSSLEANFDNPPSNGFRSCHGRTLQSV